MMNTVRKSKNLLPFPVISAAANGDTEAMCAILKHYEGYISATWLVRTGMYPFACYAAPPLSCVLSL